MNQSVNSSSSFRIPHSMIYACGAVEELMLKQSLLKLSRRRDDSGFKWPRFVCA
jgi:hypothetical protein